MKGKAPGYPMKLARQRPCDLHWHHWLERPAQVRLGSAWAGLTLLLAVLTLSITRRVGALLFGRSLLNANQVILPDACAHAGMVAHPRDRSAVHAQATRLT